MERRKFLTGTGALAAGIAGASSMLSPKELIAKSFGSGGSATNGGSSNLPGNQKKGGFQLQTESSDLTAYSGPWTDTQLLHLLRRCMFGVPIAQWQAAKALGSMSAVVAKLTDMTAPLPPGPSWVNQYLAPVNGNQPQSTSNQNLEIMRTQQVVNWWFDLMVNEDLSMREKLTYMWANHFVTGWQMVQHAGYTFQYLQLMRSYALGNLQDFVYQVSIDPSMLVYLNGNQNFANNVNENYARELMELFTLGLVDPQNPSQPNYTEADVQNSAKALTGWSPTTTANATAPYFSGQLTTKKHDVTTKTFLGQTGNWALQDILNIIFEQENGFKVAWFISKTIYESFVYYNAGLPGDGSPQQGVITAMANMLIASKWDLQPVVQALLSSAHFYDPNIIGSQLKSPAEFIVGTFREFGVTYTAFNPEDPPVDNTTNGVTNYKDPNLQISYLTNFYMGTELGQTLLNPPNVAGWPGGENWIGAGSFADREAFSYAVLSNAYNGGSKSGGYTYVYAPTAWAQSYPNSSGFTTGAEAATAFSNFILPNPLGPIESGELATAIFPPGSQENFYFDPGYLGSFVEILTALPEYQLT